jgi:hypothetical protein
MPRSWVQARPAAAISGPFCSSGYSVSPAQSTQNLSGPSIVMVHPEEDAETWRTPGPSSTLPPASVYPVSSSHGQRLERSPSRQDSMQSTPDAATAAALVDLRNQPQPHVSKASSTSSMLSRQRNSLKRPAEQTTAGNSLPAKATQSVPVIENAVLTSDNSSSNSPPSSPPSPTMDIKSLTNLLAAKLSGQISLPKSTFKMLQSLLKCTLEDNVNTRVAKRRKLDSPIADVEITASAKCSNSTPTCPQEGCKKTFERQCDLK